MPFSVYFGWGLIAPTCFSLLYGFTARRVMCALGYEQKSAVWDWILVSLPSVLLLTLWSMVNISLPVIYVLFFLIKLIRISRGKENLVMKLFLVNLCHLMSMALHMILISVIALAFRIQMTELLFQPFWRILTICTVLAFNSLIAWFIPQWDLVPGVLRTQTESEEVKPFIVFLCFCNVFLLLDSVLCISPIRWSLLPVFLIGSTVLLEFCLIHFLSHIYSILKMHYLEEEHRLLMAKLEQQNLNAANLRSKTAFEPMTGAFSRRYTMEQIAFLLREKEPFSLIYIDLDHLKRINDRDGHHAGDLYLIRFAREFGAHLRKSDIFGRVGGDEFVVLLPGCSEEMAKKRMDAIRDHLTREYNPPLSFSYGISFVARDSRDSAEQILRQADQAMYRDKQARTPQ